METPDRFDFELDIGHGSGRAYPVAARSAAGQARGTLHLPFGDRSPASVGEELAAALAGPVAGQGPAVQAFGQSLFDALFGEDVLALYDASRRQAGEGDRVLRLKLRVEPPELAELPWEFLYDARLREYICLVHTPLIRYQAPFGGTGALDLAPPGVIGPLDRTPPLRILAMVAASSNAARTEAARQKQHLEEATQRLQALELVKLEWVPGSTWRDLVSALSTGEWHVFALAGEGGLDPDSGEGFVTLAAGEGRSERVSAARLSRLLASHKSLQLVTLSPAGARPEGERDRFAATAALLVERGIPAVLAMQYPLGQAADEAFLEALYAGLAATLPIDLAMAKARLAVQESAPGAPAWGIPALHAGAPGLRLFEKTTLAATARRRGDEALAADEFERAVVQYTLAAEMGADPVPREQMALAKEAQQVLARAGAALGARAAGAEPQAEEILGVSRALEALLPRLPGSQAIQGTLLRVRGEAGRLRDRLWQDGRRLMQRKSVGLTLERQCKQMEESVHLLQGAIALDREDSPALREDLVKAQRRLSYLENARVQAGAQRGKRWRTYGLIAAALLAVLVPLCLVFGLGWSPGPAARATSTVGPVDTAAVVAVDTAGPTRTPTGIATIAAGDTAAPASTATPLPTIVTATQPPAASDTATPESEPSATPEPAATQPPTATPTVPAPAATQTPTTAAPATATSRLPAPSPTASPSPRATYEAPTLLQPADIVFLSQSGDTRYTMRWLWEGTLAADEWFDVRIWQTGLPHYGVAWTKELEYVYDICLKGNGLFYWSVAIVQGRDGQWEADLSPEASPRRFSSSRSDKWCRDHGRWVQVAPP